MSKQRFISELIAAVAAGIFIIGLAATYWVLFSAVAKGITVISFAI